MSTLLLNLRHVPDDEADEVRALLGKNHIGFFETQPSRWGVSAGAIWIADDHSVEEAWRLMDAYQAERQARARAERAAARRAGTAMTGWATVRAAPLRVLLVLLSIAFALALVALPVLLISW